MGNSFNLVSISLTEMVVWCTIGSWLRFSIWVMIYLQLSIIFSLDFQVADKFELEEGAIKDIEFGNGSKR